MSRQWKSVDLVLRLFVGQRIFKEELDSCVHVFDRHSLMSLFGLVLCMLSVVSHVVCHNLLASGEFRFDFGCVCKMNKIVVHNGVVTLVGSR